MCKPSPSSNVRVRVNALVAGNDVGNATPAQGTAAASIDQQQAWQDAGRDSQMENTLITELIQRLKGLKESSTQPQ